MFWISLYPPSPFDEFPLLTLCKFLIRFSRGEWVEGDREPTFPEFARWLISINVKISNEHWQPISWRCRLNAYIYWLLPVKKTRLNISKCFIYEANMKHILERICSVYQAIYSFLGEYMKYKIVVQWLPLCMKLSAFCKGLSWLNLQ